MTAAGTILFSSDIDDPVAWDRAVKALRPELEVVDWRAVTNPASCRFALMFTPPDGGLGRYPNLAGIQTLGAGINQLDLASLPDGLPLARLIDPSLTATMVDYSIAAVFRHFRALDVFERDTRARHWAHREPLARADYPIGILGLGVLGGAIAEAFRDLGFPVSGWSRSSRTVEGVTAYAGAGAFGDFLGSARAFVCVLPLTAETRGILSGEAFARMPAGSVVVNVGRGAHVVDGDLVAAIASGHIAGATLDVFHAEPLAEDHPFYGVPEILVTPHVAGGISPASAAPVVIENYDRAILGRPLVNAVDRTRGY